MTTIYVLLAILGIQQALDVWTTNAALTTGRAREANPIVRGVMDAVGVLPALVTSKLLFGSLLWLTVAPTTIWYVVLGLLIALYVAVLVNNVKVLKQLGVL